MIKAKAGPDNEKKKTKKQVRWKRPSNEAYPDKAENGAYGQPLLSLTAEQRIRDVPSVELPDRQEIPASDQQPEPYRDSNEMGNHILATRRASQDGSSQ